jgi:3-oxoacyl-[acyl-carrier protein] reductase
MSRKIAIITGVSRLNGIGKSICIALAERGFDIFFTYWLSYDREMPWKVKENEPELIQQEIEKIGVKCCKIELNLAIESAVETLFNEVENTMGSASVLVNNATYSTQTNIESLNAKELDKHYNVNLKGTTLLTLEFIKRFKKNNGGRIINLTSGQSLGEMNEEIAYAITKGAIETLTKTISQKIAEKGITINAVNPGPTDTGWMKEALKKEILKNSPMKRIGTPKDISKLIGFLASDDSEWITGQIIHSEGGFIR